MKIVKKIILIMSIMLFLLYSSVATVSVNYALTSSNYTIRFVSIDTSNYPKVRVYYKIYDQNGEVVDSFKIQNVYIYEKVAGGEYLQREVKKYEILSDTEGLNTSLVVDRSTSLNNDDLVKIKEVLNEFIGSMDFGIGDSSEVISFGSDITIHTNFTKSEERLLNAIGDIELDGKTKLYDALYKGVQHAKSQNGARCVIGFTDGQDNASSNGIDSVIDYAVKNQVPIYIVSVGNYIDEVKLKRVADETGGRYWNIDDLEDFFAVLKEIYVVEKSTYYFEYITDIAKEQRRNLRIVIDDGINVIEQEDEIVPVVVNPGEDFDESIKEETPNPNSWYQTIAGLWYYIEADGKTTRKGWFTDARDNQTYFLDRNTGVMAVGWTQIDGEWYYFNESHNNEPNWYEVGNGFYESLGKKVKAYGSMYRDEMTPDGQKVDATGKLVSGNKNSGGLSSQLKNIKSITSYSADVVVEQMDSVTFGSYQQSISNEPIEWLVLENDSANNKVLLLSKYILDCKCYNSTKSPITWEQSSLRKWLNEEFYNLAFSDTEKKSIQLTNVINSNNGTYGTNGGNNTSDKVFLLSSGEAIKYFYQPNMQADNRRFATKGTGYAKSVSNRGDKLFVNNRAEWCNGNSWFWLRSPANAQDCAASVNSNGYLDEVGDPVNATKGGVRPAIWVSY